MILQAGEIITTRKARMEYLCVSSFRDIEWFRPPRFSLESTAYGSLEGVFEVKSPLNLLNLGNSETRQSILENTDLTSEDLNPDNQYSGDFQNTRVHQAIMCSPCFLNFHGTIISEGLMDEHLINELSGPEEVVLFTRRLGDRLSLKGVNRV